MSGYLLVRSGGSPYGLPLDEVDEVVDGVHADSVPGTGPAVRGIARLRDHAIPVVHLATVLRDQPLPESISHTVVVARCCGKRVAFEVDDADEVVRGALLSLPAGRRFPWASGVAEYQETLVPIVDLTLVGERLTISEGTA